MSDRSPAFVALALTLAGAAAAGGFFLWEYLHRPPAPAREPAISIPTERPQFTLPDVDGQLRDVSEWDGKLLVVNFWATWCPPCREEIPMFTELQQAYGERGVQFLGVAIDDLPNVKAFMQSVTIGYPVLHGQLAAIELGKRFGNAVGALPYTVLVGREGRVIFAKAGVFERPEMEELLLANL